MRKRRGRPRVGDSPVGDSESCCTLRMKAVRKRIAVQVPNLDPDSERDALHWMEAVSEFDADGPR